jgi:DNA primase
LESGKPYSDPGNKLGMTNQQRSRLRRRIPLLLYLEQQGWKPKAYSESDEVCGLCPLHRDSRPSFYVNRRKDVFYCHGCGQGGDVIRLAELLHGMDFRAALATLGEFGEKEETSVWSDACDFYQHHLQSNIDAQCYLRSRGIESPAVIERMRIGYAPGGCLRAYLEGLGYSRRTITASGLTDEQGRDRLWNAITFPLEETASMYGRHLDPAAGRHRFLARPKGGLYGWQEAKNSPALIVVEGLFDLASLWQAGFSNAVALLGSHGNGHQQAQLLDGRPRTVYFCLDADENGSGQRAAQLWCQRLRRKGQRPVWVRLPDGDDPNRFFAGGGGAAAFSRYLEEAGQ